MKSTELCCVVNCSSRGHVQSSEALAAHPFPIGIPSAGASQEGHALSSVCVVAFRARLLSIAFSTKVGKSVSKTSAPIALRYVPTTPTPPPSSISLAPLQIDCCISSSLSQSLLFGHASVSINSRLPVQT